MSFRLTSPLARLAGALFAGAAAVLWFLDRYTTVSLSSGIEGAAPTAVALGVAALVTLGVLLVVSDSAFED